MARRRSIHGICGRRQKLHFCGTKATPAEPLRRNVNCPLEVPECSAAAGGGVYHMQLTSPTTLNGFLPGQFASGRGITLRGLPFSHSGLAIQPICGPAPFLNKLHLYICVDCVALVFSYIYLHLVSLSAFSNFF